MSANVVSILQQYVVWITLPLMCLGLFLLAFSIMRVIRVVKNAHLLSVPLLESQEVEFSVPGRVILCGEGPVITFRFKGLSYELIDEGGAAVYSRTALFRAKTSGFSWSRMEFRVFHIWKPGRFTLRISGLGAPQASDAKHRIVFMRPHLVQSIACILGMLLGAGLFVVDLVFFILSLTGNL